AALLTPTDPPLRDPVAMRLWVRLSRCTSLRRTARSVGRRGRHRQDGHGRSSSATGPERLRWQRVSTGASADGSGPAPRCGPSVSKFSLAEHGKVEIEGRVLPTAIGCQDQYGGRVIVVMEYVGVSPEDTDSGSDWFCGRKEYALTDILVEFHCVESLAAGAG